MAAVAGRYARAFADVVADRKLDPEKTIRELNEMAALVTGSVELRNIFENPSVHHKQKIKLLDAIIKKMSGSVMLRNFVAVLVDQRRIAQIGDIAEQFAKELDARMGIAQARVESARALSDTERIDLERQLAEVTGKIIRATYAEDAGLLGGAVVRVGSVIYDGSVRGQLERMKQKLVVE
jgi:F-type H+-transporting ATPase subunit delta